MQHQFLVRFIARGWNAEQPDAVRGFIDRLKAYELVLIQMSKLRFRFVEIVNNHIRLAVIIIRHRLIGVNLNIEKDIKISRMRQFVFRVKFYDIRKPYLSKEDNILRKQLLPLRWDHRHTEKFACAIVVLSVRFFILIPIAFMQYLLHQFKLIGISAVKGAG